MSARFFKISRLILHARRSKLLPVTILLISFLLLYVIKVDSFVTPASATETDSDTMEDNISPDHLWLLYADKEHYSYNETVVISGHIPLEKLVSDQHVTIDVLTPDGSRYIKTTMEESVANNG